MVRIQWHGHACISIVRGDGYTIVVDPHDGSSIGLRAPEVRGDLILVTHNHFDHNAVGVVRKSGSRVLSEFSGKTDLDNVIVNGFQAYHDKQGGKRRGKVSVYVIEVDGKRVAHLGDLGDIPRDEVINALRGVDLLAIPVGGTFTIEPEEAWKIVELVQPLNVLPIHYWVRGASLPLRPIDDFLKYVRGYEIIRHNANSFILEDYKGAVHVLRPP